MSKRTKVETHPKTIFNVTKNKVVVENLQMATNPWTRFWGLMGKPGMPEGVDGLWIEPCADIHSFFLRFEFDAVFLNKEGEVLHLMERMKPWRISKFVKGGRVVLEMDGGQIARLGIQLGDILQIQH